MSKGKKNGKMVHSYEFVFNGFSAFMDSDEATEMAQRDDVLKVIRDEIIHRDTDFSPSYIARYHNITATHKSIIK